MLLVWHWLIWEKLITKKRITILIKETMSLLSLTLETENESLDCSLFFLLSEKTKTQNQSQIPGAFGELNDLGRGSSTCLKTYCHSRKSLFYFLLIFFHGCSLVEDFKNFRLCCSAASHANMKLPAAKYMV